ncbi:MAG: glycosyltransferase, partial [Alphaproteobacteria bacterium]|nr:glycosyltransferase [Alphaproteobacteria bacterium]
SLGLKDRVQFLGHVNYGLLPQLFSAADAVVLPSESEGLANVWVEALARGTPIVVPDVDGARELLTSPAAGRLAARDSKAIAAAVREILADPPQQQDVAEMVAGFSWGRDGAAIADIRQRANAMPKPAAPVAQD